jgi:hypothetical protein
LDGQLRRATDAKKLAMDARRLVESAQERVIEEVNAVPLADGTRPWKRALGVDGSYMIPFVGFNPSVAAEVLLVDQVQKPFQREGVVGLLAGNVLHSQRRILEAASELTTKLTQILTRIQVWQGAGAVTIRAAIYQSLVDVSDLVANLKSLDNEAAAFAEDTRRLHSFTEDDKVMPSGIHCRKIFWSCFLTRFF